MAFYNKIERHNNQKLLYLLLIRKFKNFNLRMIIYELNPDNLLFDNFHLLID